MRRAFLPAFLAAVMLGSCGRDFQSPFDPESETYAGAAWAKDGDGNGVADSVEKYAPNCRAVPRECLGMAIAAAKAGRPDTTGIPRPDTTRPDTARPDTAKPDTVRPDTVKPDPRIPVRSVRVEDMTITVLTDADSRFRLPEVAWTPADATDKGYVLESEDPKVARIAGQYVEAVANGETKVILTTSDGGRQDAFKVKVSVFIGCGGLLDPCGKPGKGKNGDDEEDD